MKKNTIVSIILSAILLASSSTAVFASPIKGGLPEVDVTEQDSSGVIEETDEQRLNALCDYIRSLSPEQMALESSTVMNWYQDQAGEDGAVEAMEADTNINGAKLNLYNFIMAALDFTAFFSNKQAAIDYIYLSFDAYGIGSLLP